MPDEPVDGAPAPPPPPLPPPPPPPAPPTSRWTAPLPPGATRIRWGMADVVWILLAQLLGSTIGERVYRGVAGVPIEEELSTSALFWVVLPAGAAATIAVIALISRRKGRRSLRADFGFQVRWRDWTAFFSGAGLQVVLILLLVPFALLVQADEPAQELVEEIEDTRSALLWVGIVSQVAVVQPAIEEVIFRGLLLRSLLRRWSPPTAILVSGFVFGGVHITGTGVNLAGLSTIVGLSAFGIVLAVMALRHGSLSRSILAHTGFNVIALLLSAAAET